MEVASNSQFPEYADGDVVVVLSALKQYKLHASVLRRSSSFFERKLSPEAAAHRSARARKEGLTVLYYLELISGQVSGQAGVGQFRLKEIDSHGRPSSTFNWNLFQTSNSKAEEKETQYWDWLLGIFYSIDPKIDGTSIAVTLQDCMGLIEVAESVGATKVIRKHIDLALTRHTSVLYSSIATHPIAWADLGYRIHSHTIFKEAIVHMVGKWNMLSDVEKKGLRQEVQELCQRKFEELDIAKAAIEIRILGHYPASMSRNALEKPGRPAYSSDIYLWMSLCFFRQWFAQAISDGRNRAAPDGGHGFYESLSKAGPAYLDHESFRNFYQYFPMSSKGCSILEANMNVIKEEVKPFVKDLMRKRTANASNEDVKWLTCTIVEAGDFPWTTDN